MTDPKAFAYDAKQPHGHRYARFQGLVAVACQCLIAAATQNTGKITLAPDPKPTPKAAWDRMHPAISNPIGQIACPNQDPAENRRGSPAV